MPQSVKISAVFDESQLTSSLERAIRQGMARGFAANNPSLRAVNDVFSGLNGQVQNFDRYLDRANQRIISLGSSAAILYGAIRTLTNVFRDMVEVDKAITDINANLRLSSGNLSQFQKGLFDAARATTSSWKDAAEAAKLYSRQGLDSETVIKRTTDALTLMRISGLSAKESVDGLTNATNIFSRTGITTHDLLQKIAAVSSRFSISADDLVKGFTRVGAEAQDAGLSINQIISILAAAKVSSGRDGEAIATALSTIFTRLKDVKTVESLQLLGVQVRDAKKEILPAIDILQNLAKSYDTMGDAAKSQIDKIAGGARQVNILKAAFSDLNKTQGINAQVSQLLSKNTDDATRIINEQNKALSALIENFQTTSKQIGANFGKLTFAGPLRFVLQGNPIVDALKDADGQAQTTGGKIAQAFLKGFGNALIYGAGPFVTVFLGQIIKRTATSLFKDIGSESGLLGLGNKQKTVQEQIVTLYNKGNTALKEQLATMDLLVGRSVQLQNSLSGRGSGTGFGGGVVRGSSVTSDGLGLQRPLGSSQLASIRNELRDKYFNQQINQAGLTGINLNTLPQNEVQRLAVAAEQQVDSEMSAIEAQNRALIRKRIQSSYAPIVVSTLEQRNQGLAGYFGTEEGDISAIRAAQTQSGRKLGYGSDVRAVSELPLAALAQSRAQRIQSLGIGASFALPFLGGALSTFQGEGGTTQSRIIGSASNALNLGGIGAGIGSFFPGVGTLVGAGVGAGIGAITGLASNYSKSSDEVDQEVSNILAKQQAQLQAIQLAFQTQEQLKNALKSNNLGSATELKSDLLRYLSTLDPQTRSLVINQLNNPEGLGTSLNVVNQNISRTAPGLGFLRSVSSGIGAATSFGRIINPFGGYDPSQQNISSALPSVIQAITTLSNVQLKALQSLSVKNPQLAISEIGKISGLNQDQIKELLPTNSVAKFLTSNSITGGSRYQGLADKFLSTLIQSAIDTVRKNGLNILPSTTPTKTPSISTPATTVSNTVSLQDILGLVSQYQNQAKISQITSAANLKIQDAIQKINLQSPALTDIQKLGLEGQYGGQNINSQVAAQIQQTLYLGKSSLVNALGEGADTKTVDQVKNLRNIGDLKSLQSLLQTTAGNKQFPSNENFIKALNNLIDKLDELNTTQKEDIRVNDETNALQQAQLNFKGTLGGAFTEDVGTINQSSLDLQRSLARNDEASILDQKLANLQLVTANYNRRAGNITEQQFNSQVLGVNLNQQAQAQDRQRQAVIDQFESGNLNVSVSDYQRALFTNAQYAGLGPEGNAKESLTSGFTSTFAGSTRDLKDFSTVGEKVGQSLQNSLGNAFGNFITGTQKAKDAFRSFIVSVLGDAARALANKAVSELLGIGLSAIFGAAFGGSGSTGAPISTDTNYIDTVSTIGNTASGGPIGFASGGGVPVKVMGGEFIFGPSAARRLGAARLRNINTGMAAGGLVKGGSKSMDDQFGMVSPGSYVIRKAMVDRYGASNLAALASMAAGGSIPSQISYATPAMGYASGGDVTAPAMATPSPLYSVGGGGGSGNVQIGVTINDHSTKTTTTSTGDPKFDKQFAEQMAKRMQDVALQTILEQQRVGGVLRKQSQYNTI